jgi:hypothetical protein
MLPVALQPGVLGPTTADVADGAGEDDGATEVDGATEFAGELVGPPIRAGTNLT